MTRITVSLSPDLLSRLRKGGVTTQYAAQILGVGVRQAGHLLRKAGATYHHHGLRWRMGAGQ